MMLDNDAERNSDMTLARLLTLLVFMLLVVPLSAQQPTNDSLDNASKHHRLTAHRRLSANFMEKLDRDRAELAKQIQPIDVPYAFVRGVFHAHSHFSHDSQGTLEEIVAAAKATRTQIIGLTEHPSRTVDVVAENVKGWHDGVYFLAGTENSNELHWPEQDGEDELRFVAHPEEVPEFDRKKYHGMEIYNTHSDVKDEPIDILLRAMVLNLLAVRAHPEAAFLSFLDPPDDFLARFDRLTTSGRFSGLAANDSHQNQGVRVIAMPKGKVTIEDAAGKELWQAEGWQAKLILTAFGHLKTPTEPTILANIQFDPYDLSMRHVGTFLQIDTINESTVRSALRDGRIVLGFEIVAPLPAVGFWMERDEKPVGTVGDEITWKEGLELHIKLPAKAEIRVVRNGASFAEVVGDELVVQAIPAGVFRMEAFQKLAGERYPWVISNPIYVVKE